MAVTLEYESVDKRVVKRVSQLVVMMEFEKVVSMAVERGNELVDY